MALTMENVSFGPVVDFSLSLPAGAIYGLHGYSGAGKTTIARLLTGYLEPTCGRVLVDDQPLPRRGYRSAQLIQQHPERAIDPRWRLSRVVDGIDPAVLSTLGIEDDWLQRRAGEVSGGQLQRIAIARALDNRTQYLVADEITTMMDAILQAEIWSRLVTLVEERDMGLLVISHDQDLLQAVCSKVFATGVQA